MKLIVLMFCACCLHCVCMQAQEWSLDAEAGYLHNKYKLDSHGMTDEYAEGNHGFRVGANVVYTLKCNVVFSGGLAYERTGGSIYGTKINYHNIQAIHMDKLGYVSVPVHVGYKIALKKKFYLCPQVGLYGKVGVKGYGSMEGVDGYGQHYEAGFGVFGDIPQGAHYANMERLDAGLSFAYKIGWDRLALSACSQLGLVRHRGFMQGPKTRAFGLSLSYTFWRK
ncbi:MAG: outer membrane beta-barrel protein [Bacteroidaceae bacterium]|nr:outer membrane beta-barrel protein [Bacteroidaceae bacterium]